MESLQPSLQVIRANTSMAATGLHFVGKLSEVKAELSHDEMQAILAHRVSVLYGMSVEEYKAARKAGTLPERPGDTALAVFSGEAGTRERSIT